MPSFSPPPPPPQGCQTSHFVVVILAMANGDKLKRTVTFFQVVRIHGSGWTLLRASGNPAFLLPLPFSLVPLAALGGGAGGGGGGGGGGGAARGGRPPPQHEHAW